MSSTNQDPDDSILLASLGEALIAAVVEACTFILIYGVFVLLFSQTSVTYFKKKQATRAQHWMFLTSVTTFLLATVQGALLLGNTGIIVRSTLVGYQDLPLAEKLPLVDDLLIKPYIINQWIINLAPAISDGIVVWRVIVLLHHRQWLKILPSVLLLASFASSLVYLIFITAGAEPEHGFVNNLAAAGDGLSLVTNVIATALVGYVYWLHRRDMVVGLGRHQPTQAERVLALLVESGIAFCVPQTVQFILGFIPAAWVLDTAGNYALLVFETAYDGFAVMYPTLVIALVNNHRTLDHISSTTASLQMMSHGANPDHTITIRFSQLDATTSVGTLNNEVQKSNDVLVA